MKVTVNIEFEIGQSVRLRTEKEQSEYLVTAILLREGGVSYQVTNAYTDKWAYGFEISAEVDVLKELNLNSKN